MEMILLRFHVSPFETALRLFRAPSLELRTI